MSWKTRISKIFERKNAANEAADRLEKKSSRLECKISQLVIEKEFFLEKCEELDSVAILLRCKLLSLGLS